MGTMLRIAGTIRESIVDGPGIRFVVFAQGCRHHCPGCHNPQTHDLEGGTEVSVDSLLEQIRKNPLLDGITLSGGEPFEQAAGFAELARRAHEWKLQVMTYTGYMYEEILAEIGDASDATASGMAASGESGIAQEVRTGWKALLEVTDILVDGRFELDKRNLMLKFRGSENQRLIDVKKSRTAGEVILKEI